MNLNVLVAATQVPFTRGGAEILVDGLVEQLKAAGCNVDLVQLPFQADTPQCLVNQVRMWRSLDLSTVAGRKVDVVIPTKFPSYLVRHPRKSTWLVHQHRQLYDLFGSRFGACELALEDEALRQFVVEADLEGLSECRSVYSISANVAGRLSRYLGLDSGVLTPPLPLGKRYFTAEPGNYILSVGRICSIKRVDLIVKAMAKINPLLSLKIVGVPDESSIAEYLNNEISKHHLWQRVEFLGRVSETELLKLYSEAFAVYYAPYDEDYGFVTLEGLASGKPVITAHDSGGVLEFVRDEVNGLISAPTVEGIALAINRLFEDKVLYARLSENACDSFRINTWEEVLNSLLG